MLLSSDFSLKMRARNKVTALQRIHNILQPRQHAVGWDLELRSKASIFKCLEILKHTRTHTHRTMKAGFEI